MADPKSKSKAALPLRPNDPDIDSIATEDKWWLRTCGFPRPHSHPPSSDSASSTHRTPGAPPPTRLRAILSKTSNLWPNASTIPVIFVKPSGTPVQREKVRRVAVEWERWANIKFSFVSEGEVGAKGEVNGRGEEKEKGEGKGEGKVKEKEKEKEKEEVTTRSIRVMFDESEGPWSLIARAVEESKSIREPTMNLGNVTKDERMSNEEKGAILHEFGHALGFLHEHQSLRRDERITLRPEVIIPFYTQVLGWKEEDVKTQILDVYSQDQVSNYSEVDLSSVMIYFMPPSLNKENITIRPISQLSDKDKAFALLNYPFVPSPSTSDSLTSTRPPFPDPTWTLDRALDIIGFTSSDSPARQRIIAEFDRGDWDGVRLELGMFTLNARAAVLAARILGGVAGGGGGVDGGVGISSGGGGEVKAKL